MGQLHGGGPLDPVSYPAVYKDSVGRFDTVVYRAHDLSGTRPSVKWRVPIRGVVFQGRIEGLRARVLPDPGEELGAWTDSNALLRRVGDRYGAVTDRGRDSGSVLVDADDTVPPAPAEGWAPIPTRRWGGLGVVPYFELREGTLSFDMDILVERGAERQEATLSVAVDLVGARAVLGLSLPEVQSVTPSTEHLEFAVPELERGLAAGSRLVCCFNCALSDYFHGGTSLTGMLCFRGAREAYRAVTSKRDYVRLVPDAVTEDVDELYVCSEFEHRQPGTGYRG